jgi:2-polyprenyl-3-methyl-5-hydroxy-6-metoxy-1,4-benzoquinol methylase
LIAIPTSWKKEFSLESVVCDLCGRDQSQLIYSVPDTNYGTPGKFSIVQCRICKLVYLNPRPSAAELPAIYPETRYDPFQLIHTTGPQSPHPIQWSRARQLTQIAGAGRVLDVGCGDGLFLKAMQQLGWTCVGVEPNQNAVEFARTRFELDIRSGEIFAIGAQENFDLITLWDALEHTPSPTAVLLRAAKLLPPTGRIALSVPNWDSFERLIFRERWIALDAPRHLYHFSPRTVTRLLNQCGFEIQKLEASAPVLSLASNLLRLGGDLAFRRGQAKATVASGPATTTEPSLKRKTLIRVIHWLMLLPNSCANLLQRGSSLTILARKTNST